MKTLAVCLEIMPERQLCVARELTKKFEEFRRGTAAELLAHYQARRPRGEIVLMISGGHRSFPCLRRIKDSKRSSNSAVEIQPEPMRSNIACAESFMTRWRPAWLIVSPHLHNAMAEPNRSHCPGLQTFAEQMPCFSFCDYHVMSGLPPFFTPLLAGLGVTLVQLAMAVCLLAPQEPVTERYSALIEHDSYWFMNIIDRGLSDHRAADRS